MVEITESLERQAGEPVMTSKQVCSYLNISRATLYNKLKRDESFPHARATVSKGKVRWFFSDIDDWYKSATKSAIAQRGEQ
jgi:predicted DNA-binding transcriptional regulator AlpA